MKRGQRPSADQVVLMLRQIEVQTAQGKSIAVACKEADVSEQKFRDECLRQEIFYSLREAQVVIGLWQNTYNRVRPHSSLGYRPPAPVSFPDLAYRLPMGLPSGPVQNTGQVKALRLVADHSHAIGIKVCRRPIFDLLHIDQPACFTAWSASRSRRRHGCRSASGS
ncbi:hypothetical protein ASF56_25165 [Methylobacterium sp. Leaf122]|nr:hypothetical protein ASF56_25165 [Methylobacterium sp. Leaf122]